MHLEIVVNFTSAGFSDAYGAMRGSLESPARSN
jgi:hypothetical protein